MSLGYETVAGGPTYGAGSFATADALRAFLVECEIDVSSWSEGEALGVHGLLDEADLGLHGGDG